MQGRNWEPFPVPAGPHRRGAPHPRPPRPLRPAPAAGARGVSRDDLRHGPDGGDRPHRHARLRPPAGGGRRAEEAPPRAGEARTGPHPARAAVRRRRTRRTRRRSSRWCSFGETGGLRAAWRRSSSRPGTSSAPPPSGCARARNGASRTILFSGDIGRWDRPIINDPRPCDQADYVLMESTYGDSLHGDDSADRRRRLRTDRDATPSRAGGQHRHPQLRHRALAGGPLLPQRSPAGQPASRTSSSSSTARWPPR